MFNGEEDYENQKWEKAVRESEDTINGMISDLSDNKLMSVIKENNEKSMNFLKATNRVVQDFSADYDKMQKNIHPAGKASLTVCEEIIKFPVRPIVSVYDNLHSLSSMRENKNE
ncbi:MAG: hypothetical protein C0625_03070 [Arcobacter sp.]|nr:MAG: hypothetical protein C0625_03070 [Arcobacter sp.]